MNYTEENIKKILDKKDISKGIIVVISEGEEEKALKVLEESVVLEKIEHLKKLNSANVYYCK